MGSCSGSRARAIATKGELPLGTDYVQAAIERAEYVLVPDERACYGTIPGLPGIEARAHSVDQCRAALEKMLDDWVQAELRAGRSLPIVDAARAATPPVPLHPG